MMDLPDDWWQFTAVSQRLSEWFSRHLLPLFVVIRGNNQTQHPLYTGLLLYYERLLFWITAGHVIEEMRQIVRNPQIEVLQARWLDRYQIGGAANIPVSIGTVPMFSYYSQDIDFGACLVTELNARLLLTNNNVQIMNEEIWRGVGTENSDGYYLLGYPEEYCQIESAETGDSSVFRSLHARCACLPVRKIAYRGHDPFNHFWDDPEAIYGEVLPFLDSNEQPQSVSGMSGGPLFSIERDPNRGIVYRLCGIQRSWDSNERLIRVEPIHRIVRLIEEWVSQHTPEAHETAVTD